MINFKIYKLLVTIVLVVFYQLMLAQNVVINEFMAVNNSIIEDGDGNYSDWMELYNTTDSDINLKGWCLTDNKDLPLKWVFPEIFIPAKDFLIVFASGKDKMINDKELHTNFKLSGSGEYLGLIKPDGVDISHEFIPSYPQQYTDISYGKFESTSMYFAKPTPGAENIGSVFMTAPIFSVKHGYYDNAFDLKLIAAISDVEIYYTTDASSPSSTNGMLYAEPIKITTTTVIRAVSYTSADGLSPTSTSSYIFAEDVKNQSNNQPGYPNTWLSPIHGSDDYDRIPANYDMKEELVNDAEVNKVLTQSLKNLPVISIVTDINHLFSESTHPDSGGIYTYNGEPDGPTRDLTYHLGRGWQRQASVEYFNSNDEDGAMSFQSNCAIKIHGGATRTRVKTEKHSFKLGFKSEYGPSKLKERVFGKGSPKEYDWLVLRGGFAPRLGMQVIDPWAKQTISDMGQYAAYNKFVHVFINGLYWGMYNLSERLDENCMRDNLGGRSSDYDIVKDYYEIEAGDTKSWDKLVALAGDEITEPENYQYILGNNSDGTPNPSFENLLNPENFIDYIMMNVYAGNQDWDHHNWVGARRRTNSEGFHFLTWDAEKIFNSGTISNVLNKPNENRPTGLFADLIENEQFQDHFISRVNKHFFEGGALTPQPCLERYENILAVIDTALISDQVRWVADEKEIWNTNYHKFIYDYFPSQTETVFRQFVSNDLYPAIDFPLFSNSNNTFIDTVELFMSSESGDRIFYTLDGTDPGHYKFEESESVFVYNNEPLPLQIGSNIINARVKQDSLWSRLITKKITIKSSAAGVGVNDAAMNNSFQTYPNPVDNMVQFDFAIDAPSEISIKLYNVYGLKVASVVEGFMAANKHSIKWNMHALIPGVYICVFENSTNKTINNIRLIKN